MTNIQRQVVYLRSDPWKHAVVETGSEMGRGDRVGKGWQLLKDALTDRLPPWAGYVTQVRDSESMNRTHDSVTPLRGNCLKATEGIINSLTP